MHLIVDANIPAADACFGVFGRVTRVSGREITRAHLEDADALIVRSVTPVGEALLAGTPVRFVGTCTIGTDHVDRDYLAAHGIGFASAPGCNAEAVADYVLSSLLTHAEREGRPLLERRVGIVGAGNVGRRVQARLEGLGMTVLVCDPPRAEREGSAGFAGLDALVERCDVLCLHTPLVREGRHATRHLLGTNRIAGLQPGSAVLNAGRGDCVDGAALYRRLTMLGDIAALLDVWENEPGIDAALHAEAALATPHIAGYSLDGKLRGSLMIHHALAGHLGSRSALALDDICPPPALAELTLGRALPVEDALRLCARAVYDARRDHDALRRRAAEAGTAAGFDACRAGYPLRREFATLSVRLEGEARTLAGPLAAAGFTLAA
ncbi:4-phosphoerythronate dehydrogenase PdxB [Halomonas piscis]|uniref:Erythronate-4-phosphate dehydrogenase n=1 Tax=Halomonas piscis TaxID=3031727 RepID=A0ABY9YYF9_9GAMM|nr:4-phosphoerythronate dehydrogenase PdxB [Halomonas piscis]WNK19375.1 4-phosphoerythronate dehydrogenase PdxB [Halomonas piscis]